MEAEKYLTEEILIKNNIKTVSQAYNNCKATIKIELSNGIGSGFFLQFQRNDKKFYCLITNQHIISPDMVENEKEIKIKYDNDTKDLLIKLDKKERIIEFFKEFLALDVAIIEIIPKDKIDYTYFLSYNEEYDESYKEFINKDIEIYQYPLGGKISLSFGKILEIFKDNDYMFYHDADTQKGSSGSPIVLRGKESVIGIHTGGRKDKAKNYGIFIGIIIDNMETYKKNGEWREYYKNGNLKYEGNFLDDEYDGNGKFYYENGDVYIGQFKNGKKHGDGCICKNNEFIKEVKFENDQLLEEQDSDNEENEDNNDEKIDNEKSDDNNDENNIDNKEEEVQNENNSDNKSKSNNDSEEDKDEIREIYKKDNKNKINENSNNNQHFINNPNNNKNNNNIIGNNNNNPAQNKNNFFKDVQKQIYHILKGPAGYIGLFCRCGHEIKLHETFGYGQWKCKKCPIERNICAIK